MKSLIKVIVIMSIAFGALLLIKGFAENNVSQVNAGMPSPNLHSNSK